MKSFAIYILIAVSLATVGCGEQSEFIDTHSLVASLPDSIRNPNNYLYYAKVNHSPQHHDSLLKAGLSADSLIKPSQFNSGFDIQYYRFTSDDNASLGLFGILNLNLSSSQVLIVKDYLLYKDIDTVRYGIGLRLYIKVNSVKKGGDISSVPKIAASVELSKSTASYHISGIGFNLPPSIQKDVFSSDDQDFNVTNFAIVQNKFDKIASVINDSTKGLTLAPQIIPKSSKQTAGM